MARPVWLTAQDGVLTVRGGGKRLTCEVVCTNRVSGGLEQVAIPGLRLRRTLEAMICAEIHLKVTRSGLEVSGDGATTFAAIDTPVPEITTQDGHNILMTAGALRDLLRRTVPFMCADPYHFNLCAVHFAAAGATVRAIATDGRRMAIAEGVCVECDPIHVTVPAKAAKIALSQIRGAYPDTAVTLTQDGDRAIVRLGAVTVAAREASLNYPNWRRVMIDPPKSITVDRLQFTRQIERAAALASAEFNQVKLSAGNKSLCVSTDIPTVGQYSGVIPARVSADCGIVLDPHFVLAALALIKTADVDIGLSGAQDPALIRGCLRDGPTTDWQCIIMPIMT